MRALVTGSAGFIGSQLAERLLEQGHEVVGVDGFVDYYPRAIKQGHLATLEGRPGFRFVEGLLEDTDLVPLVSGVDRVFHLAAQAGVRASWGQDFSAYTSHNVLATQRLFEAAVAAGKPKVVFASSSSVYGESTDLPLREAGVCLPVSPYGVTKLACEHLARVYASNHGLDVVSLRYFTVYGPRQRPDMAFHRFLKALRDDQPITVYGDGEQTRDFTFVSDAVAATLAAGESGRAGAVYNVGGGERISINRVLELMRDVTRKEPRVRHEPAQKGDMRDTSADTSAAERDLGFASTVTLRDGLEREWEWIARN